MNFIKKKILTGILSVTVLFSAVGFSACGNSDLEAKLAKLESQITQLKDQNEELQASLIEKQEQITQLEQDMQELEEEIQFLEGKINEKTGLENGFKPSNGADDAPTLYCAYKSDTNEFNIDDVTLEFFFGGHYASGVEHELSHSRNYPTFDLYFMDDEGNNFFVKRIEENFVSQKYSCEVEYDKNWYITEIKYNHSEKITIPSGIFTKESGQIWFEIHSTNVNELEPEVKCITGINIFYKVTDGKVILSSQQIN